MAKLKNVRSGYTEEEITVIVEQLQESAAVMLADMVHILYCGKSFETSGKSVRVSVNYPNKVNIAAEQPAVLDILQSI